jgi:disulfide bond formation protein DsbB
MKKSSLLFGIIALLIGIAALMAAINQTDNNINGILFGLAGSGIGLGIGTIINFIYWSSGKNKKRYEEILERKNIEVYDELNEKIRAKAGRITNSIGLAIIITLILTLTLFEALGFMTGGYVTVVILSFYMLVNFIVYVVVFNSVRKEFI